MKKQPVALLDVDHTLLFGCDDTINPNLTTALLNHGITKAYLFTDMIFKPHSIKERNKLVKDLEEMGFAIQGVITPCDLSWSRMDIEEIELLHHKCIIDRSPDSYKGKLYGTQFDNFMIKNKDVFPNLFHAATEYNPENFISGYSYNEASIEYYNSNQQISENTMNKSFFSKLFADHLSHKLNFHHNKGLLLNAFLRNIPEWVGSVLVFDDNDQVIFDMKNYNNIRLDSYIHKDNLDTNTTGIDSINNNTTCNISTSIENVKYNGTDLSIPTEPTELKFPLVTIIPVTSKNLELKYYNKYIIKHMKQLNNSI